MVPPEPPAFSLLMVLPGMYRFSASCCHGFLINIETMQATWQRFVAPCH
jgi:hypothetical protein